MAKLNVEIPAVNVKVDGIEYHKVDRPVQAGDIVRIYGAGLSYITEGGFYEVDYVDDAGDAQITDNEGDSYDTYDDTLEVYEKVTEKPQPSSRLTVGDYVRILPNSDGKIRDHIGEVAKIVQDDHDDIPYTLADNDGKEIGLASISEVEPATEAEFLAQKQPQPVEDDVIIHEGRRYRKVARKANVGERVLIVASVCAQYSNGKVYVVEDDYGNGPRIASYHGGTVFLYNHEYVVLEPIADVKPPRLKVGEYAKVTDLTQVNGKDRKDAAIGDVFVIIADDGEKSRIPFRCKRVSDGFVTWFRAETLVRATDAEVDATREYNVGDYVEVVRNGGGHDYAIGEIVKVTSKIGRELFHGIKASTGKSGNCLASEQVKPATKAQYDERNHCDKWAAIGRKVNEYRAGDLVRVIGYGAAGLPIGHVDEVDHVDYDGDVFFKNTRNQFGGASFYLNGNIELVTPVEQRFDKR